MCSVTALSRALSLLFLSPSRPAPYIIPFHVLVDVHLAYRLLLHRSPSFIRIFREFNILFYESSCRRHLTISPRMFFSFFFHVLVGFVCPRYDSREDGASVDGGLVSQREGR